MRSHEDDLRLKPRATARADGSEPPGPSRFLVPLPGIVSVRVLACLGVATALASQAASTDPVPEGGPGLAARQPAGEALDRHPAVIFAEDFEPGNYRERWDEVRDANGKVLRLVSPGGGPAVLGRNCLQVTSTLGENTGGGLTKWFAPADRLFIRFYVKFAEDCDYVHHFVTLRANRSLQGSDRWSGFGGAGVKPSGDRRFSTALEPWGNWGNWPAPGRWNFYNYWHEMKPAPDGKFWGNSFKPDDQPDIAKGRWICAEFMLQHNTPGKADGAQAFWIDGKRMGHWQGINWRTDGQLMANALTLESYVTDRWTKNRTNTVFFDELVIAREYIGPAR